MLKYLQISFVWIALLGVACGPIPLLASNDEPAPAGPPVQMLSPDELDTLLAPIALYPDPLLAQILPAATLPSEIVLAHRYVKAEKDPNQIDAQPWDESVKALARYPDVLKMMDKQLDWTTKLGEAFVAQPSDVFASVQRLRAKAQSFGNLQTTPQQVVSTDQNVIQIMPADPQVIYVPQYQPQVVYVQQPPNLVAPLITFGAGLALGVWIHNSVNWHSNNVYYNNGGWNNNYHGGGNYYNNSTNINRGGNNVNINGDVNIGKNNGNSGSVWKPQTKPATPKYGPGTGNNGGLNGNRPGNGTGNNGGLNGNRPGNGIGNNGGINGNRPDNTPGNRPGLGGNGSGQKPTTLPAQKPNGGNFQKPTNRPQNQPALGGGNGQFNRDASKVNQANRPAQGTRPTPASRPAAANRPAPAANRPAPASRPAGGGAAAANRPAGGGAAAANRGGGGARPQR